MGVDGALGGGGHPESAGAPSAGASLAHGQAGAALARGGDEPAGGSAQKELAGTQALRSLGPRAGSPAGTEPVDWLLLSTWPIKTLKMARRLVRWYSLRWSIECWHKVLKVVCGVEKRQMKTARVLERALALDMIIASRALLLNRLGKEHPDLPAELFYTSEELEVIEVKKKEAGRYAHSTKLTVLQANILVAMLAGFWARAGDGHPGAQVLSEGLRILQALTWYTGQCAKQPERRRPKRNPT